MPLGDSIVSFKGRLWIAEGKDSTNQGTRLYRSKTLADPALWVAVNDFVDVGSGDGQNIVQLAVYFNTLLIFRVNSIYGLQYTSDPAAATISLVVPNVGLNSKEALDQFESFIYFMYEDKAYEFSNNRAAQINVKVPFRAGTTSGIYLPFAVSEFNRRIVFSFYDTTFVYSLRTRTWTNWKSDTFGAVGKIVRRESGNEAVACRCYSQFRISRPWRFTLCPYLVYYGCHNYGCRRHGMYHPDQELQLPGQLHLQAPVLVGFGCTVPWGC